MERINVSIPMTVDTIHALKAGDCVLLSGVLYTARDAAHDKLFKLLKNGEEIPIPKGACIYYTGPCPSKDGEIIGPCGPTTSARMDAYTPSLVEYGINGFIGKGARSQSTNEAMRHGAIYFVVTGGAAVLISESVESCETIAFSELEAEAIRRLIVKNLPAIVATDATGHSIFDR